MILADMGSLRGKVLDRLVGKDDAPAERHAGRVALEHLDLVRRIAQLHRDREIKPRRPAADAGDLSPDHPRKLASLGPNARARVRLAEAGSRNGFSSGVLKHHRQNMAQQRACRTDGMSVWAESGHCRSPAWGESLNFPQQGGVRVCRVPAGVSCQA